MTEQSLAEGPEAGTPAGAYQQLFNDEIQQDPKIGSEAHDVLLKAYGSIGFQEGLQSQPIRHRLNECLLLWLA